jgi:UDP-glucose 4-epimerase
MTAGRALLTGGSGLIGFEVLSSLKRHGWTVTSCDIRESEAVGALADETMVADAADIAASDLEGYDTVIHLAAMLEPIGSLSAAGPEDPAAVLGRAERMIAVNVVGTQRLFAAAVAAGLPGVVYASTVGVYGTPAAHPSPTGAEVGSDGPYAPFAIYSYSKLMAEGLAASYARSFPTRFLGLRPTLSYGIGRLTGIAGGLVRWIMDAAAGRRAVLGTPFGLDSRYQTVYVKDMADAFVDAARVVRDGAAFSEGTRAMTLNAPVEEYLAVADMLTIVRDVTGNPDVHVEHEHGVTNILSPRIRTDDAIRILGTAQRFPFAAAVADIAQEARAAGMI